MFRLISAWHRPPTMITRSQRMPTALRMKPLLDYLMRFVTKWGDSPAQSSCFFGQARVRTTLGRCQPAGLGGEAVRPVSQRRNVVVLDASQLAEVSPFLRLLSELLPSILFGEPSSLCIYFGIGIAGNKEASLRRFYSLDGRRRIDSRYRRSEWASLSIGTIFTLSTDNFL